MGRGLHRVLRLSRAEHWAIATPPHYEKGTHRLYWAKELASKEGSSLNYAVRVLGRRGVLELNAVAPIDQLGSIRQEMKRVIVAVEFNAGHRYQDFDPDMDQVAAYGLGALILGKVASKAGFFAVVAAALVKAKKLVVLLVVGVVAMIKKLASRKTDADAV